jgi:hexosaminidase
MTRQELMALVLSTQGTPAMPPAGALLGASKPRQPAASNFPPVWPYPTAFSNGTASVNVAAAGFTFTATTGSPDLTAAFARFQPLFFPHAVAVPVGGGLTGVTVSVANVSVPLQLGVDESYTLTVPVVGVATISAATVYGAYHGLQTLSQLVRFDFDAKAYSIANAPWTITDAPRFPHRELLVDSARHFLPVWTLQEVIASMTYAKINVLHWHLVDSQSFPFDAPSLPLLSKGAYSAQERYTVEDVAQVVEFARQRGVRVMVEIDTPGHAASWCAGYPDVCPSPVCLEPLNPATNATFELLSALFMDVTGGTRGAGLFPDNVMHLGGDEVNTACWTSTPAVAKWLAANGFTADQAYMYFVQRAQAIAHGYGRDVVGWEEIWFVCRCVCRRTLILSASTRQGSFWHAP